jgi:DNA repair protein RecO (recombination protein O)
MIFESKGIVFRNQKFKESSVILDIYTESHGLLTFVVNGVRKSKARISPSSVQLMSIVDVSGYYKNERSLHRVKDLKLSFLYESLPFDVIKASVGTFMIELSRKCIKEESANPDLFQFLVSSFKALDSINKGLSVFHLNFMINLAHYLGILPHLEDVPEGELFFDLIHGELVQLAPYHGNYLGPQESQLFLKGLQGINIGDLSKEERRSFIRLMLKYYEMNIPNLGKIHSHEILETVLS